MLPGRVLSAYDIAGWAGFLAVAAGVAATLTGLIFVAMSISLARILEFPGLPEFAAETIVQLLGAMVISLVALVPGNRLRKDGFNHRDYEAAERALTRDVKEVVRSSGRGSFRPRVCYCWPGTGATHLPTSCQK
jgi:hypothetical protein